MSPAAKLSPDTVASGVRPSFTGWFGSRSIPPLTRVESIGSPLSVVTDIWSSVTTDGISVPAANSPGLSTSVVDRVPVPLPLSTISALSTSTPPPRELVPGPGSYTWLVCALKLVAQPDSAAIMAPATARTRRRRPDDVVARVMGTGLSSGGWSARTAYRRRCGVEHTARQGRCDGLYYTRVRHGILCLSTPNPLSDLGKRRIPTAFH